MIQSNDMPQASAVYSSGAMTGGGARRKASVMKYCPSAPVSPKPAIHGQASAVMGTQLRTDQTPLITVMIDKAQTTVAALVSVRDRMRIVIPLSA